MKRIHTAKRPECPECNCPVTKVTCVENKNGRRYRYRRCKYCDNKFKTSQSMTTKDAEEIVVPYLELVLLRRQHLLRGTGHSKLTPDDVKEIREMWAKAVYKDKTEMIYMADKFNVQERAIRNIITGRSWRFVS